MSFADFAGANFQPFSRHDASDVHVEIDISGLEEISRSKRLVRPFVEEYLLPGNRHVNLLGEGRLVNLASAEGHPSSVMDMSFANQALSIEYMVKQKEPLAVDVYPVPEEIDRQIAMEKLETMGISIDALTEEQKTYLSSWTMGT